MELTSRSAAQQRADDIRVFRQELGRLETEGALVLSDAQRDTLTTHHEHLLAELSRRFDVDRDVRARQLSWGMRIASFLGALALAASVFFLFYQFWGHFSATTQVAILVSASLASFVATMLIRRRDATGYFTKLAALVAFACFVLNLVMVGQIFNITPTDNALIVWAAFAFLLAYSCDQRLLLAAGILCVMAYTAARVGTWGGLYWLDFGERPENFFPVAVATFHFPQLIRRHDQRHDHRHEDFAPIYRVFGLLAILIAVLILSHWGRASYLPLPASTVEGLYQLAGFALSAATIWLGLRQNWNETVNVGLTFFVIFLYTKFFDWWWELMPKYLFFLILGLTAVLILLAIKRLRHAQAAAAGATAPPAEGAAR